MTDEAERIAALIELAERVMEHGQVELGACDYAITDNLGFVYGLMQSEHLPSQYDHLHAELVAALLTELPIVIAGLRALQNQDSSK